MHALLCIDMLLVCNIESTCNKLCRMQPVNQVLAAWSQLCPCLLLLLHVLLQRSLMIALETWFAF